MIARSPELRRVGIAEAFKYAADNRGRYGDFFDKDGALHGPGFTPDEAAALPEHLRSMRGVVVSLGVGVAMTAVTRPSASIHIRHD